MSVVVFEAHRPRVLASFGQSHTRIAIARNSACARLPNLFGCHIVGCRMRPAYLIILIVLNFFWAAALSAYKVLEQNLDPGGIVTLRFGLAAVSLLVLWPWLPGAAPRGRDLAKTCALGLVVFVLG